MQAEMATAEETGLATSHRNKDDAKLAVKFYMSAAHDELASKKAGRPIYKDVPFVEIWTPGDATNVIKREAWLDQGHPQSDINRFRRQWEAFQAGKSQDAVSGTPVDKLPGITEGQVRELQYFKVRTVEQLADMPDAHGQGFMGIQSLKRRAQDWLDTARGNAPLEAAKAAISERDNRIEALEQQLKALAERTDALSKSAKK